MSIYKLDSQIKQGDEGKKCESRKHQKGIFMETEIYNLRTKAHMTRQ